MERTLNNLTIYQFNNVEKALGLLMLAGAIAFNLWIYRLEPTAKLDPNDNTFQFALVDRTNQIWDHTQQSCASEKLKVKNSKLKNFTLCTLNFALLFDHWVPNWAEGYNLPYYYSHLPQITIVASWRLFSLISQYLNISVSLFQFYHLIIYLLLSLFPLSVFLSLRLIRLPWLTAGFGALIASHLSTDGLYGLDPASFVWRGYGLSSQLFAMIWLPLAIAYSWKYLANPKLQAQNPKQIQNIKAPNPKQFRILDLGFRISPAVLALAATTAGHLGIGMIAFLSIAILAISLPVSLALSSPNGLKQQFSNLAIQQLVKLTLLFGGALFLLGYWIIPAILDNDFHNISVWDPIWKFNSYGAREVLKNLLNGDLFDFGRFPILTGLVFLGFFAVLRHFNNLTIKQFNNDQNKPKEIESHPYFSFALLFTFWLVLYFGRTTWGSLVDFIPGMREFHLSRFIVGVHLAGLFLVPIGLQWISYSVWQFVNVAIRKLSHGYIVTLMLAVGLIWLVYPQTIRYATHNDTLIARANDNYQRVESDITELLSTMNSLLLTRPGRTFAGRGGSWGREFKIAETPYYIYLSTYGLPTVLWLPQTWSPNSDTEQYFSENKLADYDLYNIRYVVAPPNQAAQPFWKLIKETASWKLYEVATLGYFASGSRPAVVVSDKESFLNVVRLWIQSDYPQQGLYPQLALDTKILRGLDTKTPRFQMADEVTYRTPDNNLHSLFAEPPRYLPPSNESMKQCNNVTISSQENMSDMVFKARVEKQGDSECLVILKQTYHPNWKVTVDGRQNPTLNVFPFFVATQLKEEGTHEVVFSYQPSRLKMVLVALEIAAVATLLLWHLVRRRVV